MILGGVLRFFLAISIYLASSPTFFTEAGWNLNSLIPERFIQRNADEVLFTLYPTKESLRFREELVVGDKVSLEKSSYNKSRPIIVLVHGFISNSMDTFQQTVKNAYLETDTEANIVTLDWGKLATPNSIIGEAFYVLAMNNIPTVGRRLSEFLIFLMDQGALSGPESVHLIGHSLGAHVCGKAGRYFLEATGFLVERITGLDPAGPVIGLKSRAGKLDESDAKFVDIVHSNAGKLGYYGLLGHVDFYPNGGMLQPNCSIVSSLTTGACEHSASYRYFAKSIFDPTITACRCDKYFPSIKCLDPCVDPVIFGEHCPPTARGEYYLSITY